MASPVETWNKVRNFMRTTCGVVLSDEQIYLLEARIQPLVKTNGFTSIDDFVVAACSGQRIAQTALIDAMTTHETFFFRDAPFWRAMEETVLPRLMTARSQLRIWIAASSTGQEVYSLAMLLHEKWPLLAPRVDIVASDVSEPTINYARRGLYTQFEVNRGLGAARLVRHFVKAEGGYQIRPELQWSIAWKTNNLLRDEPPTYDCDLVLCRNVLIYFSPEDKASAVARLQRATRATGIIGVGSTELLRGSPIGPGLYSNQLLTGDDHHARVA